ncbi:hypothetical protein DSO57_1033640 [Entomophthora muscae]|uniref:Uncharacterized protein n=1 Tax=Entomophthora muscae TaxID=34485 RepID=A0ACC2ULC6_9FUNG|nr:hypothetical protein DSO57_1033640 [Entomophthora muscae]
MNDISILALKIWESNPSPQEMPCIDQGRQEPARLPVGPNPEPLEMPFPNQEEQEPAILSSIKTKSSISTLETIRIPFSDTTAIMQLSLTCFPLVFACLHLKELNITHLCSFCLLFPGLFPSLFNLNSKLRLFDYHPNSGTHTLIVNSLNPPASADYYPDLEIDFLTQSSVIKTGLYFVFLGSSSAVIVANLTYLFILNKYEYSWSTIIYPKPSDLTETLELNPNPPKANQVAQDRQGPINSLSCKPELLNYSETCQILKDDSPNGQQIAFNLTYAEVAACLKEVKTRPTTGPANDHQLPPVSSPEWAIQLTGSGDVVNSSGRTKHLHFCSPEQAQPESAALKTLSQDPCPVSKLSSELKSTKSEVATSSGISTLAVWG